MAEGEGGRVGVEPQACPICGDWIHTCPCSPEEISKTLVRGRPSDVLPPMDRITGPNIDLKEFEEPSMKRPAPPEFKVEERFDKPRGFAGFEYQGLSVLGGTSVHVDPNVPRVDKEGQRILCIQVEIEGKPTILMHPEIYKELTEKLDD